MSSDIQFLEIEVTILRADTPRSYRSEIVIYFMLRELLMKKQIPGADRYFEEQTKSRVRSDQRYLGVDIPIDQAVIDVITKHIFKDISLGTWAAIYKNGPMEIVLKKVDDAAKAAILRYIDRRFAEEFRKNGIQPVPLNIFDAEDSEKNSEKDTEEAGAVGEPASAPAAEMKDGQTAIVMFDDMVLFADEGMDLFNHAWDDINRPSSGIALNGYGYCSGNGYKIIDGARRVSKNRKDTVSRALKNRKVASIAGHSICSYSKGLVSSIFDVAMDVLAKNATGQIHLIFVISMFFDEENWQKLQEFAGRRECRRVNFHILTMNGFETKIIDNVYRVPASFAAIDAALNARDKLDYMARLSK